MVRALMIMGTGSDVGKSLLVAGLCRAFKNRGLNVAPFKPQNMSNNAAVTTDGGEIGRAQALQARAAGLEPITAMNPVLLKPEQETGAQVIVHGKRVKSMAAKEYFATRAQFMPDVLAAFEELGAGRDLVIVEGAGSASEVNLRHNDLANFGFARAANVPVILAGDIQRGGVIASIVGTHQVIDPEDEKLVVASLINKFQGDPALFEDGKTFIAERTGRPCLGPVPYFADAWKLPAEDVLSLIQTVENPRAKASEINKGSQKRFLIVVPRLRRIANFDDLDPLRAEPNVELRIIPSGTPLPADADLIILPGSKATRADMEDMRREGWDLDVFSGIRHGAAVLGICGGYQMLGKTIADPDGVEGAPGVTEGLGLFDVETTLAPVKELRVENAEHLASGTQLSGYHMHMGLTDGPDRANAFATIGGKPEGAALANGKVMGTYLHGLFASDEFRRAFLVSLGGRADANVRYEHEVDAVLDQLAAHLDKHLDLDKIFELSRTPAYD